ncbi:dihydrofolate reductase family protein [Nonomuraea sediminis]|uniref:dihydrofolate reductase family protein n=1 Tax=Nonomuraea sediminis TaxID=2835864 RepID=UPI001BDCDC67|nr:dihydrofolate reductase family protein [Nonomuraea sediminis]
MTKIVAGLFISLDGVVEAPEKWHFPYFNDEMGQVVADQMAEADAMLLGRHTYDEFAAFWPDQKDDEFADKMNGAKKYVVSTTVKEPSWQNTSVLGLDDLRADRDETLSITGSPTLIRSLLSEGLLDELRLLVHPIVVGEGRKLFDGYGQVPLRLIDSRTFGTGVLYLTYGKA